MVPIACRHQNYFLFVVRYRSRLVERLGVVGFPGSMGIKELKVNGSSWCTIFLGTDDHPMALCDWFANGDGFQDS